MGIFQQFSASILATLIIGIATVGFSLRLATLSNIRSGVETSSPFVKDSSFIYRNNFGIPHIIASNEHDVFFALGYAQAQDRLWQMDFYRRIARGRLSEIIGNDGVQSDRFFRVLGITRIADKLMKSISKQSLNALEAYSEGVNAFIAEGSRVLPIEFGALDYSPEPWKPADCLVIGRLMSFDMSMSFWTDLAIGEIAENIGVEKALEFIPDYPLMPRLFVMHRHMYLSNEIQLNGVTQLYEIQCKAKYWLGV